MPRRSIWDDPDPAPLNLSVPPAAPPAQTVLQQLRPAPVRRDTRRRDPVVTYRGIPPELHARLKRVAEMEYRIPVGELVRYCLEHALLAVTSGALAIEPSLSVGRRTLFPAYDSGAKPATRQRKSRKSKPATANVSYRGIPPEIVAAVSDLANRPDIQISVGELARHLLEFALDQIDAEQLKPTIYEVTVRRSFYE